MSKHAMHIRPALEEWEIRLGLAGECLDLWFNCQHSILYLESVFCGSDITQHLPTEGRVFGFVEKTWKVLMKQVLEQPNALTSLTRSGILEALQICKVRRCAIGE